MVDFETVAAAPLPGFGWWGCDENVDHHDCRQKSADIICILFGGLNALVGMRTLLVLDINQFWYGAQLNRSDDGSEQNKILQNPWVPHDFQDMLISRK